MRPCVEAACDDFLSRERNYCLVSVATLGNKTQLITVTYHKVQSFIPRYLCVLCNVNPASEWSVISHTWDKVKTASSCPTSTAIAWLSLEGVIQQSGLRTAENKAANLARLAVFITCVMCFTF